METMKQAQNAPTPATIFSLFHNGKIISVCVDKRFNKILNLEQPKSISILKTGIAAEASTPLRFPLLSAMVNLPSHNP